ncbi:MAG TPA: general secretion pathway protein GspK [Planctomycetaceae bacterium]|nr:general secretion pathway protein GspK [Planctomycetaceae bacterium]
MRSFPILDHEGYKQKQLQQRSGFFLVVVLVVVAVATLAAYSFTETMLAYDEATHLSGDHVQTRAAAESGVEMTRLLLSQPADMRDSVGGVLNNPAMFQAMTIVPPETDGRAVNFSIIAPGMDEMGRLAGVRLGLRNESSKLNVNALIALDKNSDLLMPAMAMMGGGSEAAMVDQATADLEASELTLPQSLLMSLPGMTIDVADAILDWLDDDEEARPNGAELEFYSTLPTPYAPKNGPIDSVEELLLVRGVTPALLFGVDANRNGVIDPAEQQMAMVDPNSMASLGWAAFLTVHGQEGNKRRDGTPRININQDDLEAMYDEVSSVIENPDYATFVMAFRVAGAAASSGGAATGATGTSGGATGTSGGGGLGSGGVLGAQRQLRGPGESGGTPAASLLQSNRSGGGRGAGGAASGGAAAGSASEIWTADAFDQVDLTGGGGTKFSQVLDLIDGTVTLNGTTYMSPFTSDPLQMAAYMPLLMESLTTQNFQKMPGRININECPAELLYGIPLLDAETADAILEARAQPNESENRRYETWPLVEGLITMETMRSLMPLVTAGGDVFAAQVIGYHETAAAATRLEVIIDATGPNPRVVQYRDLSHLGRGFDLSVLGIRHFIPDGN